MILKESLDGKNVRAEDSVRLSWEEVVETGPLFRRQVRCGRPSFRQARSRGVYATSKPETDRKKLKVIDIHVS